MTNERSALRRARRWLVGVGCFLAFATALVGVAHTKWGRPLLGLFGGGVCPVGAHASLSPAELDRARTHVLASRLGGGATPSKEAFGFVLGTTTRADVTAWAAARHLTCAPKRGGNNLHCTGFAATTDEGAWSDGVDDAHLLFDAHDTLIGAQIVRSKLDPAEAARTWAVRATAIEDRLGEAARSSGEGTSSYLAGAPLRQAYREYRFSDLTHTLRATNVGGGRISLTEYVLVAPTT